MNKSTVLTILLLIILFIPATVPLFRPDFYSTHDGVTHVVRFVRFHEALVDGQFPPRWADGIAFNLGSPVLMYNAPLPYLAAELPLLLGATYAFSIELIFAVSLVLSGVFFYLWSREIFGNMGGFVGALFYVWAPYRFVDVYVRGAFPEHFAFMFPPLMLLAAKKMIERYEMKWFLLAVFSIASLILSHNVMFVLFGTIYLGYSLVLSFKTDDLKKMRYVMGAFVIGVLLTSAYLIPAYFEKEFSNLDKLIENSSYLKNTVDLPKIIYSPWGWGPLDSDSPMSPQLGLVQILVVVLASIFFIFTLTKKQSLKSLKDIHYILFVFLLFISVYLMTSNSSLFWDKISLLAFFLYPWRFLTLAIFSAAVIAAYLISKIQNYQIFSKLVIFIFVVVLIYANRNHLQLVGTVSGSDEFYRNYTDTTDMWGEFLSNSANLDLVWKCKMEQCHFEKFLVPNDVSYQILHQKSNLLEISYESQRNFIAKVNTYYFPGWQIVLNNSSKLEPNIAPEGAMEINLPSGQHNLRVEFVDTPIRQFSGTVSLVTLVGIGGYLLWNKKYLKK